jgi:hypothetical protein
MRMPTRSCRQQDPRGWLAEDIMTKSFNPTSSILDDVVESSPQTDQSRRW